MQVGAPLLHTASRHTDSLPPFMVYPSWHTKVAVRPSSLREIEPLDGVSRKPHEDSAIKVNRVFVNVVSSHNTGWKGDVLQFDRNLIWSLVPSYIYK